MALHVCIFEDVQYSQFLPLAYFRPVYDLRCGIFQLREKIINAFPKTQVTLQCRSYLMESLKKANPQFFVNEIPADQCLFINGRVLADKLLAKKLASKEMKETVFLHNKQIIAAYVVGENLKKIKNRLTAPLSVSDFSGIPQIEIEAEIASYPWELVHKNADQILNDFKVVEKNHGSRKRIRGKIHPGVSFMGKKNILIESGAEVQPGCVIDAENGPVYIGKDVKIFPQSTIIGPTVILENSSIKTGSQIYENTTIGPACKIGGEVAESIVQGYSNKQHAGFLGHSYIGSWVNLGAGTNTSDLKNNYSPVRVNLGDVQIDTGLQFVGLAMGDHSKSSINSMFNTGTVVGVCCNIFGSKFPAKYVPSFSWGAAGDVTVVHNIEKALDVAKRVMNRRDVEMTAADEKMFRIVYETTSQERESTGIKEKAFVE